MTQNDRQSGPGNSKVPLGQVELFVLTADPVFDERFNEWKAAALPVAVEWGLVTLSEPADSGAEDWDEDWASGGHRGDPMIEPRWVRKSAAYAVELWMPDWTRATGEEADESATPPLKEDDRVFAAMVGEYRCILGGMGGGVLLVNLLADLDWDDSVGVDGTVWAGTPEVATTRTLEKIVAIPKITTSGTFASGSWVLVQRKDGRWKVTGAPCP